jgi:serine 3-dehydrogenase (NADP+)
VKRRYTLSKPAERDLDQIKAHLVKEAGIAIARKVLRDLRAAAQFLGARPEAITSPPHPVYPRPPNRKTATARTAKALCRYKSAGQPPDSVRHGFALGRYHQRMPVSMKDQVVLIVGASSGIGRATAVLFAREGARVMASARREDRLRGLQEELASERHPIEIWPADAANAAEMDQLAAQTRTQFGRIDILVYATGTNTPDRAMQRLNAELWDMMLGVNLNGAYYITRSVLPCMREQRSGHLIYVSSISGMVPDVSGAAYQAAKRGLLGLAHAIRVEEKENGIRTCVICPGLVDTEILDKRPVKPSPEMLAKALQPEDVAEAVLSVAKLPVRAVVPEMQLLPTYL